MCQKFKWPGQPGLAIRCIIICENINEDQDASISIIVVQELAPTELLMSYMYNNHFSILYYMYDMKVLQELSTPVLSDK